MAPAAAYARGPCVAAALPLTCRGAEEVGETVGVDLMTVVFGRMVVVGVMIVVGGIITMVVDGAAVTVVCTVKGIVLNIVDPDEVAVFSLGTVTTSVSATEVARVMGIKIVAFVVGGSKVEVTVYAEVTSTVLVKVTKFVIVDPLLTVV